MKITVGRARNDILELTAGIVLNIIGGTLLGLSANTLGLIPLGVILFAVGIIFEVRVLLKHHYELQNLRTQNEETLKDMKNQQVLIDTATNKLNEAIQEIDRQRREIEETQDKAFSRSGSLAESGPLEDDIQRLHERLQKVEEKLGLSSFTQRKYGRH